MGVRLSAVESGMCIRGRIMPIKDALRTPLFFFESAADPRPSGRQILPDFSSLSLPHLCGQDKYIGFKAAFDLDTLGLAIVAVSYTYPTLPPKRLV